MDDEIVPKTEQPSTDSDAAVDSAAPNAHNASSASTNRQQSQHEGVVGNNNVRGRNIIGSNNKDIINDVHAPVNISKDKKTAAAKYAFQDKVTAEQIGDRYGGMLALSKS